MFTRLAFMAARFDRDGLVFVECCALDSIGEAHKCVQYVLADTEERTPLWVGGVVARELRDQVNMLGDIATARKEEVKRPHLVGTELSTDEEGTPSCTGR